jgi:hypothetical protein
MNALTILIVALYNLTILAGTAYLVVEHGWTEWTFLLSILLIASTTVERHQKKI